MPYNAPGLNSPVHFEKGMLRMELFEEVTNKKPNRYSGQAYCSRNSMYRDEDLELIILLTDKTFSVNWVGDADRGQGPGNLLCF